MCLDCLVGDVSSYWEHACCYAPGSHSFSGLLYKAPKEVLEELAEELVEDLEKEEREGDEEGETVAKALRGQRFPLPNY